jgi:hypothetical protein
MNMVEKSDCQLILKPKYDGTNIHVFYNVRGYCHIYTLGCVVDTYTIGSSNLTFIGLATQIFDQTYSELDQMLKSNPGMSCVFELISPYIVIVTQYDFSDSSKKLIPNAIIDKDGMPLTGNIFSSEIEWKFSVNTYDRVFQKASEYMHSNFTCPDWL